MLGSVSDDLLRKPVQIARPANVPAPTGARHEASVLFSLASLRDAERPAPTYGPSADDGMIDLAALASSRVARLPIPEPLPSEPPPAAFSQEILEHVPPPHARPQALLAVVGAALVLLGLGGAGVALASGGGPSSAPVTLSREARALAAQVEAPRRETALESAPLVSTIVPARAEAASSSPAPRAAGHATSGRGRHATKAARSSVAASPKPAKPSDPCGCHGDFQCAIRCSATGKR